MVAGLRLQPEHIMVPRRSRSFETELDGSFRPRRYRTGEI